MVKIEATEKKLKSFGLLMGGFFSLLTGIMLYKGALGFAVVTAVIAMGFTFASLTAPLCLKNIYLGWMKFALIIGAFNTKVILGFVYLVIFTPMHLFFYVTGKDPLKRKFERNLVSYWEDRPPAGDDHSKYEKQY